MVSRAEAGIAATHGGCTVAVRAVRSWLTAWRRDIDKLATSGGQPCAGIRTGFSDDREKSQPASC